MQIKFAKWVILYVLNTSAQRTFWNSVMSKKLPQKNRTILWKTKHRDLDIVDGYPCMFLFLAFVMIHVHNNFFWRLFEFFPDLYLAAQFLACLSKEVHPDNTLMLFRKLTYGCSLITHFKAPVWCKRSIFLRIYQ